MAFMGVLLVNIIFWIILIAFLVGMIFVVISLIFGFLYLDERKKSANGIPRKKYKKWVSIIFGIIGIIDLGILAFLYLLAILN